MTGRLTKKLGRAVGLKPDQEVMKLVEEEFYRTHLRPPWRIVKFEAGKYRGMHVPVYIAGERQLHMMQPYDPQDVPQGAKTEAEWVSMINDHGQIVIGFDALDDFIAALLKFRDEQRKAEAEMKAKLR